MLTTLFSFFPIVLLIFLMTKRPAMPSYRALPLVAGLTYLVTIFIFKHDPRAIHANVIAGFLTSWTPILIVWGAIFLFRMMDACGAMAVLRKWLNAVTENRVAQLMIVGWAFPFLIEGASGFGTPAALAAPILVGLGFKPLPAAIMVLCMNSVPVSFGAVGTPTWFGFSGIALSVEQVAEIGIKSALIHGLASLLIPILALRFLVSWSEIKANLGYIYLVIIATMLPYIAVAFWSYEFPALVGGGVGLLAAVGCAQQGWGLAKSQTATSSNAPTSGELLRAGFPLWGTVLLLVVTRVPQLGLKKFLNLTQPAWTIHVPSLGELSISPALVVGLDGILNSTVAWSHKLLYVPSLLPFGLIGLLAAGLFKMKPAATGQVFAESVRQVKAPAVALFGALIFVKLMMMGGDEAAVNRLGEVLANLTGGAWYSFAAVLGAVGSFFSGSNTISNLTFGPIQQAIAIDLGLNQTTVLALQSVGGAMGNMVCINNIVAVCSVLAINNQEGYILLRTVRVLIPYAVIAALAAVLI